MTPISAMVLIKSEGGAQETAAVQSDKEPLNKGLVAVGVIAVVAVAAGVIVFVKKKKK